MDLEEFTRGDVPNIGAQGKRLFTWHWAGFCLAHGARLA
jgi:hypothetical protein